MYDSRHKIYDYTGDPDKYLYYNSLFTYGDEGKFAAVLYDESNYGTCATMFDFHGRKI